MSDVLEPFVVRSHHMRNIANALAAISKIDEGEIDKQLAALGEYVRDRVHALKMRASEIHTENLMEADAEYAKDLLGSDTSHSQKFIDGNIVFYRQVLELPADHPVRIETNARDEICKSCAVGKHCQNGIREEAIENEMIRQFVRCAKDACILVSEIFEANPGNLAVTTTMENFKPVLSIWKQRFLGQS